MESHSLRNYIPAALAISVFGVYLSTMCPTVYLGDSGEFTASAFCLGIPHNSGYPLYALLGKLFCLIPLGNIGFRVNLMSTVFAVLTVWLVYSFILKTTFSRVSAFVGSLVLTFAPVFWSQTVCAEVYTLHTFFVALLIRLLWWWDEKRTFCRLALFVFITGLSFGNHMQTVMLAPAVLFLILSADRKTLLNLKNFLLLSVFFLLALSIYLYLPIRTDAGAAIHWGDPNTLSRFLAHVTGRAHRGGYLLTKSSFEYLLRTKEILWFVGSQFGLVLPLAVWGWLKLPSARWQTFFVAVVLFDLVYGVFLNIISLEITPFGLPSCVILAILVGTGTARILEAARRHSSVGKMTFRAVNIAACIVPAVPLTFNYDLCNQSRNYTAYEHALNIFRTVDNGATLFLDGDNNIFPVTYGRIVERMREDVTLYDRHNLFFKMPYVDEYKEKSSSKWKQLRPVVEKRIIEKAGDSTYFAVFNPSIVSVPNQFTMYPYGILYKVTPSITPLPHDAGETVWSRYITESIYDQFQKDFMSREVSAYFHFALGKYFFMTGQPDSGLKSMQLASTVGHDDTTIHSDIAVFLTDRDFFEEARLELEKALIYYEDLSGVYNNWGYYYQKLGNYDKAARSYRKAIDLRPENHGYYNNLGLALYHEGKEEEAVVAFQKSLAINVNQPKLEKFLKEHGLKQSTVDKSKIQNPYCFGAGFTSCQGVSRKSKIR